MVNIVDIDIEQCRENDKIKNIIRLSDTIYINAINYNVLVNENQVIILLISSKPDNITGILHTYSITNVLYKIRDMEKEHDDLNTYCEVEDNIFKIIINIFKKKQKFL